MAWEELAVVSCWVTVFLGTWLIAGAGERLEYLREAMEQLRQLHKKLGKPKPGDWLDQHREPGQTFREYIESQPVLPTSERRTIYIQPLGDFSEPQAKIIELTADFIGRYFSLSVVVQDPLPLSIIPPKARRVHPHWGDSQILTGFVLRNVLLPRLPRDAVACIALTTSDLWPGEGWNYVFGQASLKERVGVWSIYRNGNPEAGPDAFRLCLLRTMKTATHEIGHMFSMLHCTAYQCNMCGSNHREEADRRPVASCPECVAKIWWASGADPLERYRRLADFCETHGLKQELELYRKSIRAIENH